MCTFFIIVPEEAELVRILMGRVSEMQAQSQIPTFHMQVQSPHSGEKAPSSDIIQSAIPSCLWENCDGAVSNRDGTGTLLPVPVLPRLGQKLC